MLSQRTISKAFQTGLLQNYSHIIGIRDKIQAKPIFLTGGYTMARLDLCWAYPIFSKNHNHFLLEFYQVQEGLAKDDYHDREEWFTFKRKEKSPELSNTATKPTQTKVSDTEHHLHQEINTQRILTALKEHRTDKKQITEQILTKIYESLKITRMSET